MKRLGLNKGRYHGERLEVAKYLGEFHETARARGWTAERFATIEGYELHGYRRSPANPSRTIYISSGIHGDEPAGPIALLGLVQDDQWPDDQALILCPCINPTGLLAGTRESASGVDLNRDYRDSKSPEARAHIAWLDSLPRFEMSLVLHEDWEADGYYFYEVNYENIPSPAESIIEALREFCPIQPTGIVDGLWECNNGIIRPNVKPAERPLWAEAVYLVVNKTRLSLTLEAPSDFPLPFRVEAHIRAVRAALQAPRN